MRKRSNGMFSVELGNWFLPQQGHSPGSRDGYGIQDPPAGSGRERPPWRAQLPGCPGSGFGYEPWYRRPGLRYGAGGLVSHRALLVACA